MGALFRHLLHIITCCIWVGLIQQAACARPELTVAPAVSPQRSNTRTVEILHWWTSGGEAKALNTLKESFSKQGYIWKDSSIIGGEQQRMVLEARMKQNNPPDAIQIQGNTVQYYGENDSLIYLDELARQEKWQQLIPEPLQPILQYKKHWVAVPINIHRSHWVWANKKIFDALNLTPPHTFSEFIGVAKKIKQAGLIPLAHGGQDWQNSLLFDSAVLSVGGATFYKKALIELNAEALQSKEMEAVFEQLSELRWMLDKNGNGRDWNLATAMVIHNKAAMQIMGDWVKAEFANAGKLPNRDYICFPYPGTYNKFIFISDLFSLPHGRDEQKHTQMLLAKTLMERDVQEKFNLIKGSIPARTDASVDQLDACGKQAAAEFKQAVKTQNAVARFDTQVSDEIRDIMQTIVSRFLNSNMKPHEATKQLVKCLKPPFSFKKAKILGCV